MWVVYTILTYINPPMDIPWLTYFLQVIPFYILVGGFKHDFYFPFHIWDVILPIDELHDFSRWLNSPTRINMFDICWSHGLCTPQKLFGWSHRQFPTFHRFTGYHKNNAGAQWRQDQSLELFRENRAGLLRDLRAGNYDWVRIKYYYPLVN